MTTFKRVLQVKTDSLTLQQLQALSVSLNGEALPQVIDMRFVEHQINSIKLRLEAIRFISEFKEKLDIALGVLINLYVSIQSNPQVVTKTSRNYINNIQIDTTIKYSTYLLVVIKTTKDYDKKLTTTVYSCRDKGNFWVFDSTCYFNKLAKTDKYCTLKNCEKQHTEVLETMLDSILHAVHTYHILQGHTMKDEEIETYDEEILVDEDYIELEDLNLDSLEDLEIDNEYY